ncbi:MAG: undecaprenyl-diphosphatase UppP, partial [Chloroflexi bacterium]|nr:undecaprenyl-diphosphatase UppP [Chloroflexota bacterium]
MTILQALILGMVQGLTEFIPVSSSAHLIFVPWLFQWNDPALNSLAFDVALHLGTLVAVLIFFARDWMRVIRAGVASVLERKIGADADRRLAWFLVIGSIPGGIVGAIFESKIDALFHPPSATTIIAIAIALAVLGLILFLADRLARHLRAFDDLALQDAILIGLAQAFAIFPGVSRSGATITAGLALGLKREAAARFSFLLSTPIIAGAGAKSLLTIFSQLRAGALASSELILFPIGFLAALVSGYACIKFLLRYLQTNSMNLFVYYRMAIAALL